MQRRLDEDEMSRPAVQEEERRVRDPCRQRQDGFPTGEEDAERGERVGEDANAVGPGAQGGASVVDGGGLVGDGGEPFSVGDAGEGENGKISREDGEEGGLQASGVAEEGARAVGEEVSTGGGGDGAAHAGEGGSLGGEDAAREGEEEDYTEKRGPEDAGVDHARVMGGVDDVEVLA